MKVCGFTIIRNAVKFDYPVREAIESILPMVDAFVVSVGNSDDGTEDLIKQINSPKIRIIHSTWDDSLREGGRVLAVETNKAFDAIGPEYDWAFYIQADEVVHEKYHAAIRRSMEEHAHDERVEGLLFDYVHFYGSYDYIGNTPNWYRHEIRIIRNNKKIRSYRDAQGFRIEDRKLRVKKAHASVYHYGWVKPPSAQQAKQLSFNKMWHSDEWVEKHVATTDEFDYSGIDSLAKFSGTHPEVMKKRIDQMNWAFSFDPTRRKPALKKRIKAFIERTTGWRPGEYKNYELI